jgi:hypothetical protein
MGASGRRKSLLLRNKKRQRGDGRIALGDLAEIRRRLQNRSGPAGPIQTWPVGFLTSDLKSKAADVS